MSRTLYAEDEEAHEEASRVGDLEAEAMQSLAKQRSDARDRRVSLVKRFSLSIVLASAALFAAYFAFNW